MIPACFWSHKRLTLRFPRVPAFPQCNSDSKTGKASDEVLSVLETIVGEDPESWAIYARGGVRSY